MADKSTSVSIDLALNTGAFSRDAKSASAAYQGAMKDIGAASAAAAKTTEGASERMRKAHQAPASEAEKAAARTTAAWKTLGGRSTAEIRAEVQSISKAYQDVARSGVASVNEIARAQAAALPRLKALQAELKGGGAAAQGAGGSGLAELATKWGKVTLVAAGVAAALGTLSSVVEQTTAASQRAERAQQGLAAAARQTAIPIGTLQQAAQSLREDGLLGATDAAAALKNLLSRGYTLDQATQTIERLKDAAAFSRASHLSLGEAVVTATDGLRNENSVLVDNAGVTKNVSQMWTDYAKSIGVSTESLTKAQKIEAEYRGIREETMAQSGDAARAAQGYAGAMARAAQGSESLAASVGRVLEPAVAAVASVFGRASQSTAGWVDGLRLAAGINVTATNASVASMRAERERLQQSIDSAGLVTGVFDTVSRLGALKAIGELDARIAAAEQAEAAAQSEAEAAKKARDAQTAAAETERKEAEATAKRKEDLGKEIEQASKRVADTEKRLAEEVKTAQGQAAREALQAKKASYEEELAARKRTLEEGQAKEKELLQKAAELRRQAAETAASDEDRLRAIKRKGMGEAQQQADIEKQIGEKLAAARAAQSKSPEKSAKLAQQAQGLAEGLSDPKASARLFEQASKQVQTALAAQAVAAEQAAQAQARANKQAAGAVAEQQAKVADLDAQLKAMEMPRVVQVTAELEEAKAKLVELQGQLAAIQDKTVTVTVNTVQAGAGAAPVPAAATGGAIPRFATGGAPSMRARAGMISGPGTPTSDSILFRASRDEHLFVTRAARARQVFPLLSALNFGPDALVSSVMARVQGLPALATGGPVPMPAGAYIPTFAAGGQVPTGSVAGGPAEVIELRLGRESYRVGPRDQVRGLVSALALMERTR